MITDEGWVHAEIGDALAGSFPEIDPKMRRLIGDVLATNVLPIFAKEVEHRAIREAMRQLEAVVLELLGVPPAR